MSDFDPTSLMDISGLPGMNFDESMPVVYEPTVLEPVESNPKDRTIDLEADYSKVREMLYQQNQMLMAMGTIALENAKNSESPRHVEVFAGLMGQIRDTAKSIIAVHKDMQAITNEVTKTKSTDSGEKPTMNIENATVFMGTPAELMALEGSQMEAQSTSKVIDGEVEEV